MNLQQIFDNTDFVHASGTKEELQVAEYLKMQCEKAGVTARLEGFRVAMGEIEDAHLYADGEELTCKAFTCCGSGNVEGELYYMPGTDAVSIAGAKDKIVLMDGVLCNAALQRGGKTREKWCKADKIRN